MSEEKSEALRNLIAGPGWDITYNADGLATVHNSDFVHDPSFVAAYERALATPHTYGSDLHIEWRIMVCCWAAAQATHLNADYAEFGVFTGTYSSAVMRYIGFDRMRDQKFYLLDTFNGIPLEQLSKKELDRGIQNNNRFYFDCYEAAVKTFSRYQNAILIKGKVQETIAQVDTNRLGYVSIDLNSVEPEMVVARHIWPRLVAGAVVVLDDYGWKPHYEQKLAWDEFARSKNVQVLPLPTGQGLLIKPPNKLA